MTRASDTAKLLGAGATILDGTTISTADNDPQLTVISTDADENGGPEIHLYRNSASPADNDTVGRLFFQGENDADEKIDYANIQFRIADASDGTEDAKLLVVKKTAGADVSVMASDATETVFNDSSIDLDFRVESNGNANMFVVDAGNDRVGIGTSSPATTFEVTGSSTLDDILLTTVALPGAGVPSIALRNTDNNIYHQSGSGNSIIFLDSSQNTMHNISPTTHVFNISNAELMRINNKGLLINTNETLHSGVERSLEVLNHSGNGFVAIFKGDTAGHETVAIHNSATSGTRILLAFKTSGSTGTLVGRVTSDGSSTTYATSSDYRLKENLEYNWDATTRLKQLKPARFNWIADESNTTVDGFIAHEVSSIVPEAVSGEKDAMTEELLYVDGDEIPDGKKVGDVKEASKIDPQGIDQSKLVPLLVKTIQELEARITALESA